MLSSLPQTNDFDHQCFGAQAVGTGIYLKPGFLQASYEKSPNRFIVFYNQQSQGSLSNKPQNSVPDGSLWH